MRRYFTLTGGELALRLLGSACVAGVCLGACVGLSGLEDLNFARGRGGAAGGGRVGMGGSGGAQGGGGAAATVIVLVDETANDFSAGESNGVQVVDDHVELTGPADGTFARGFLMPNATLNW